jgi:riboflavin synthase
MVMFTGLVESKGAVTSVERDGGGARVTVRADLVSELADGDSIAVNGVCLTARDVQGTSFGADVMEETLRRSSLGPLASGDEVNLELPVQAGARLGGHVVQGHVDGVGTVEEVRDEGFARIVRVAVPDGLVRYVVDKGSVALDGVSLTVSKVDSTALEVSLIPETLERTTLGAAVPGRKLNVEVDVLAKYVEKLLSRTVEAQ